MHLGTIYLEHRIRVGHKGFTPLLLHIAIIGSYGYALKAKGCTVSCFTCWLILQVSLFVLPVIRVYCLQQRQSVVCNVLLCGSRLKMCGCVFRFVCRWLSIDFSILTLCKCELDFRRPRRVTGFSYAKVNCVFCRQRNCETQRSFLHQAFV
jgi:hypothetical protein